MYAMSARELTDATRAIVHAGAPWRSDPGLVKTSGLGKRALAAGLDMVETDGGLFGWGLVAGRFGVIAPLGISLDLLIGLLLGAIGIFELGGPKLAPHVLNFAAASTGSFAMRKGVQVGTTLRVQAGMPALGASDLATGIFGGEFARRAITSGGARDLTDQELAAMTAAAHR